MNALHLADTFLHEADDLLGQIEGAILDLNEQPPTSEVINQLFRAFHTIKGSGAMFGFQTVADFTHHVETVLDLVREGSVPFSKDLGELILASTDQIKALFDSSKGGPAVSVESSQALIDSLNALADIPPSAPLDVAPKAALSQVAESAAPQRFQITFRPHPGIIAGGADPGSLLNELQVLGHCQITANLDAVPPLEEIQADQCYLGWEITLSTALGINAIKDVFIFVEDDCTLNIECLHPPAGSLPLPSEPTKICPPVEIVAAKPPAASPRTATASVARKNASKDSLVRVPSKKLDHLVGLVGELVMNQSRLNRVAAAHDLPELTAPVEEIERLVSELRDNILGIRMMPIGTAFSRLKRLVHDLSTELGKEIDLVTNGAETELDKTVLDQLGDPLVHMIQNCVDHGIETPAARTAQGKPARGVINVAAAHAGSHVVITIHDDGQGLNPERIRAKAVEKRLISVDAVLSEKEIYNLISLPGFSTAAQVTSVSGRGVGMDVVKRQIEALRGTVSIASQVGKGTTISLTLPLTLAIIDGLLVEIGEDQFIVPMSVVTENVEITRADRARHNGRNAIVVREELIPYLRLRDCFDITEGASDIEKIVIAKYDDDRVGLVVDRVLGSHSTVIQSLGRFYHDIEIVSGATIMGNGRVALILDLAGLIKFQQQQHNALSQKPSGARPFHSMN